MNYVDTSYINEIYDKVVHRIAIGNNLIIIRNSKNIESKIRIDSITKKSFRPISVSVSLTQLGSF